MSTDDDPKDDKAKDAVQPGGANQTPPSPMPAPGTNTQRPTPLPMPAKDDDEK